MRPVLSVANILHSSGGNNLKWFGKSGLMEKQLYEIVAGEISIHNYCMKGKLVLHESTSYYTVRGQCTQHIDIDPFICTHIK